MPLTACEEVKQALKAWTPPGPRRAVDEHFFPRCVLLDELLPRSKAIQLFNCYKRCENCLRDYNFVASARGRFDPLADIKHIYPNSNKRNDTNESAISLLALLAYDGLAILTIPFVEGGINDSNLLELYCAGRFDVEKIHEFWLGNIGDVVESEKQSRLLSQHFRVNMSKFARQVIHKEYRTYDKDAAMPFFNVKKLDHGTFGQVFAFEIFEGQHKLSERHHKISRFARKEINPHRTLKSLPARKEVKNLELVNSLKDDHIVEMVTSYQQDDCFNIVFPLAMTNLHYALRKPEFQLNQLKLRPVDDCPLWEQMKGLANALYRIAALTTTTLEEPHLDETGESSRSEEQAVRHYVGYHFDLKPANILVDRRGKNFHLSITDFGLAYFKSSTPGNSRTQDRAGDEEYGPPEAGQGSQNRKYDVWSLGCIFLEVLTFVIMAFPGVVELDIARDKPSKGENSSGNGCYWEVKENEPQLKPAISAFLERLLKYTQDRRRFLAKEEQFVARIAELTKRMLRVNELHRYSTKEVLDGLDLILGGKDLPVELASNGVRQLPSKVRDYLEVPKTFGSHASATSSGDNDGNASNAEFGLIDSQITLSEPPDTSITNPSQELDLTHWEEGESLATTLEDEDEVCPKVLRSLRDLRARSNRQWDQPDVRVVLQAFENAQGRLRFVATTAWRPYEQLALRKAVDLIPQYAMRKTHDTLRTDAGIRFVFNSQPEESILEHDFSGELDDLRKLHGSFLGQEIVHTIDVKSVNCQKPVSLAKKVVQGGASFLRQMFVKNVETVEDYPKEEDPFTLQLWRELERQPTKAQRNRLARICRIVVYFQNEILVIPFDDMLRFPSRDEVSDDTLLDLKSSTVSNVDRTFEMSVFRGQEREGSAISAPSFPLDRANFHKILVDTETTFKSLSVKFQNHDHLLAFWRDYRDLKEQWQYETGSKHRPD